MAKRTGSIAERSATNGLISGVNVIDWWISQQPDPEAYRADLLDACKSPFCTYVAIRDVLIQDGHPDTLAADRIRKWFYQQPEYRSEYR